MIEGSRFVFEPRVSLITLACRDLPGAIRFYEALGWRRSNIGGDEVAFFQAGGSILALWSRAELARDAGISDEGSGFRSFSLAHNVRTPEEVDAALEAAEAAGARITRPAEDAFWGGRTGYFTDPDGHLWEIAWNPGFAIDETGAVHLQPDP
jgi:catechol 2,3-dioxygenase-like lactoylglutathione lyase family enzyme